MGILKLTRESRIVLVFIICICAIGFAIAFFYYRNVNRSEDPRVLQTRYMLVRYNDLMKQKKYFQTFPVLDSIKQIFLQVPGYSQSYEMGVVYNNLATVYISMALYVDCDSLEKQNLLKLAEKHTIECINHYLSWMDRMGSLNKEQILQNVEPFFLSNDIAFKDLKYRNIVKKRVKDIVLAQKETPRRLSVAYTNLGIIQRHSYRQKLAIGSYMKAISLWKDNQTASSNLNVLFGKPPKDRSFINKLFPPNKNK